MTAAELKTTLEMLRATGVKTYQDVPGEGFVVEFFPAQAEPDAPKPSNDPDMCPCKHEEFKHVNGLCVEGCSPEECNPEKAP